MNLKNGSWYLVVQRDYQKVKKNARYILVLDEKNNIKEFKERKIYQLNAIDIIGPTDFQDMHFDKALLLEIGINRLKPYTRIKQVSERHNFFSITKEQYLAVAPLIFELISEQVKISLEKWEYRQKKFKRSKEIFRCNNDLTFWFPKNPSWLVQDLYYAEIFLNRCYPQTFIKLCANINHELIRYENGYIKDRHTLIGFQNSQSLIENCSIPPYVLAQLFSCHSFDIDKRFRYVIKYFSELQFIINNELKYKKIDFSCQPPHPEQRLNGIQLRLSRTNQKLEFIKIEVYHKDDN